MLNVEQIAQICHEANRLYCSMASHPPLLPWSYAPEWQKVSSMVGVQAAITNPTVTPEDMHDHWMAHKGADGWVYGPVKDADKKTHPCMVPYNELPEGQRLKDALFLNIVRALAPPAAVDPRAPVAIDPSASLVFATPPDSAGAQFMREPSGDQVRPIIPNTPDNPDGGQPLGGVAQINAGEYYNTEDKNVEVPADDVEADLSSEADSDGAQAAAGSEGHGSDVEEAVRPAPKHAPKHGKHGRHGKA